MKSWSIIERVFGVAEKSADVLTNRFAEDKQNDGIRGRRDVVEPIANLIERVEFHEVGVKRPINDPKRPA